MESKLPARIAAQNQEIAEWVASQDLAPPTTDAYETDSVAVLLDELQELAPIALRVGRFSDAYVQHVGMRLYRVRAKSTDKEWSAHLVALATQSGVVVDTLHRWLTETQKRMELPAPTKRSGSQAVRRAKEAAARKAKQESEAAAAVERARQARDEARAAEEAAAATLAQVQSEASRQKPDETPKQGGGGERQDGTPTSPRAHRGAAAPADEGAEALADTRPPPVSSIPPAGEDPAPSVPSPPSGPPPDDANKPRYLPPVTTADIERLFVVIEAVTEVEWRRALKSIDKSGERRRTTGRVIARSGIPETPAPALPKPRPDSRVPAAVNGRRDVSPNFKGKAGGK